jgi:anthranilate/para-aminobenzoate synthase component II
MHGRIDMIDIDTADILFEKLNPRIAVMRYHSQIAIDLPDTLKPL